LIRGWTGRPRRWRRTGRRPRWWRWWIEVAGRRCRYRGAWWAPLHIGGCPKAPVCFCANVCHTERCCLELWSCVFEATARLHEPFAALVLPSCCPICARARASTSSTSVARLIRADRVNTYYKSVNNHPRAATRGPPPISPRPPTLRRARARAAAPDTPSR
jgi:hypothetical protein